MPDVTDSVKLHQQLDLDTKKRHLVFGDIHGRYNTFRRLLDAINYDSATEIIYSVGDLIDRGPDSVQVVEFFQNDHCHAILGNHEHMAMCPAEWEDVWMDPGNGGPATLRSLKQHGYDLQWLRERILSLPVCLDVGDESNPQAFRLLHAESPYCLSEEMLMSNLFYLTRDEVCDSELLWGRSDITRVLEARKNPDATDVVPIANGRSLRRVFCGHTPVEDVVSAHNVFWIDTFAGNRMTCINPVSLDIHQETIDSADK